jgi:D-amino peptidase
MGTKIFLMTDIEGTCGVLDFHDWCTPEGARYEEGRALLTREVNAAIAGFRQAGASEIVVVDGHGYGGIERSLLDPGADYSRGWKGPYPFGLDRTFDAVAYVGQHAKAGSRFAHLAHTGSFSVLDDSINGISVGEFGQVALIASALGIPVIFAAGDRAFALEASALVPGVGTVAVKEGTRTDPGAHCTAEEYETWNRAAVHLDPEIARGRIEAGAKSALERLVAEPAGFVRADIAPPYSRTVVYRPESSRSAVESRSKHRTSLVDLLNGVSDPQ